MHNFGRSVNRVVIPELSEAIVLESVKKAYNNYLSEQNSISITIKILIAI